MIKMRQLLVVDESRQTGEVLKAIFERAETRVTAVRNWEQLPEFPGTDKQTVLVVHTRDDASGPEQSDRFAHLPRVVIGRVRLENPPPAVPVPSVTVPAVAHSHSPGDAVTPLTPPPVECHLDDLFEYPDLMRAIERLWRHATPA